MSEVPVDSRPETTPLEELPPVYTPGQVAIRALVDAMDRRVFSHFNEENS